MGDVVAIDRTRTLKARHDALVDEEMGRMATSLFIGLLRDFSNEEIDLLEREGCLLPAESDALKAGVRRLDELTGRKS